MAVPLAEAWPALAPRLRAAPRLLVGLDFDGTLAPLAPSPALAELPGATRDLLAALAARPGVFVTIVSGRGLEDVRAKVGLPTLGHSGNHGLELADSKWSYVEPVALEGVADVREMETELRFALAGVAGVFIEGKRLSLSVHYRQVAPAAVEDVRQATAQAVARRPRFRIREGHEVLEVRPALPFGKGTALGHFARRHAVPPEALLFAGDDGTDEEAFAAWPQSVTVKVGPATAPTAARYRLAGPAEVAAWLNDLLKVRGEQPLLS